jgi:hypothetical protein
MVDLEDVVEAVGDIEDIVEELADPEELVEDFVESPLLVVLALGAAVAAVGTVLLLLLTLLLLLLAVGPVAVLASLVVVGVLLTTLAVGGFVYFRTDIPADVRRTIEAARERSASTPRDGATMSEQEAIDELKAQYAAGTLTESELEQALDDVLTSSEPERVVERTR